MGTALDVDLWGHRIRVRIEVAEAASRLRAALADHLVSDAAPLGFVVRPPSSPTGFHCLVDRSGLILARSRSWQEVVAVLAEHLTTFAPPPVGTIRTTMRAVVRRSGSRASAVLAGFPLLSLPPLVERQLQSRYQCVVDRLAVDISPDGGLSLRPLSWPHLREDDPAGHCGASVNGTTVDAVLLPTSIGMSLNHHQLVAVIASTLVDLPAEDALDAAEGLAQRARTVPMDDVSARRRALAN